MKNKVLLLASVGIDNMSIIKSETSVAAELLRVLDTHGSIESGKFADFVVLDKNIKFLSKVIQENYFKDIFNSEEYIAYVKRQFCLWKK